MAKNKENYHFWEIKDGTNFSYIAISVFDLSDSEIIERLRMYDVVSKNTNIKNISVREMSLNEIKMRSKETPAYSLDMYVYKLKNLY